MTPEQQKLVQEDLADRERQASELAAAGMVVAAPPNGTAGMALPVPTGSGLSHQGLTAPPLLGSGTPLPLPTPDANALTTVDGINWGVADTTTALDDMEMDFAKLFDPAHEEANMNVEGTGWPGAEGNRGTNPVRRDEAFPDPTGSNASTATIPTNGNATRTEIQNPSTSA